MVSFNCNTHITQQPPCGPCEAEKLYRLHIEVWSRCGWMTPFMLRREQRAANKSSLHEAKPQDEDVSLALGVCVCMCLHKRHKIKHATSTECIILP